MRELKFRVWDNKENKYLDPKEIAIDNLGNVFIFEDYQEEDYEVWNARVLDNTNARFIIEQDTGLKDADGKEIYEGDIIEYVFNVREIEVSAVGKICFFESLAAYGMKNVKYDNQELRRLCDKENERAGEVFCLAGYDNADKDQTLIFADYYFVEDDMEILGNIHENSELLEQNK